MTPRNPGIPNPESRNPESRNPGIPATGCGKRAARRGFTLLELIVSVTVLVVIMGVLVQLTTSVQRIWRRGSDVSETARAAQRTLDLLASDLAAAVAPQFSAAGESSAGAASSATTRSPLVFALSEDADATSPLLSQDGCTASSFSRLRFTSQTPRPVWGTTTDGGSLPSPSRRDSGTRLRSVLGVQYRVVETSDEADDADSSASDSSESSTPLRFSLVRSVAGLEPAQDSDFWWEGLDDLSGEPIARNVVLFSVTVPAFLSAETNETGTLAYEFGSYATRSDDSLDLPSGTETGPLPALVDIVLGLVPKRDLLQIESLANDSEREELLRLRTRVYTRRIALTGK